MIGKVVYYRLSNNVNVATIVGNRIYQDMPPQDVAFPFMVYTITNTEPTGTKDYSTKSVQDLIQVQIDMYTRKIVDASNLASYVRTALDGYTGTYLSLTIQQTRFLNDASGDADMEMGVYYRTQDYEFHIHKQN